MFYGYAVCLKILEMTVGVSLRLEVVAVGISLSGFNGFYIIVLSCVRKGLYLWMEPFNGCCGYSHSVDRVVVLILLV